MFDSECTVVECSEVAVRESMCAEHSARWRASRWAVDQRAIEARIAVLLAATTTSCLYWDGATDATSAPKIWRELDQRRWEVPRLLRTIKDGLVPAKTDPLLLSRVCGTASCVNWQHWHWNGDKKLEAPKQRLSETQAQDIYDAYKKGNGNRSLASLAEEFGVSRGTVQDIASGRSWKNLKRTRPPT